jgi:hypothetical protein
MTYSDRSKRLTHVITCKILLWIKCDMNKISKSNIEEVVIIIIKLKPQLTRNFFSNVLHYWGIIWINKKIL